MSTPKPAQEKTPDELVNELRGLVAEAERMLGESERASPAAVSALCGRFEAARARVSALYATTKGKVVDGAKTTDAAIRSHPYQALALALGIGVLLGAVVSRGRDELDRAGEPRTQRGDPNMKTVMAAVDFSAVTDRVVLEAVRMARLLKARLVLVNTVVPPSTVRDIFPAGALSAELLLEAKKASQARLVALQKKCQRRVRRLEIVRLTGDPVSSIVAEAGRCGASFLVIGAHGHTAIFEVLTGGVARGVLARSPCPVIVVPADGPSSARPGAKAKRA